MNKRVLLILSITMIFLFASVIPASAMVSISTDPVDMAAHLEQNFSSEGSAYVTGNVYSANGDINVKANPSANGFYFHKTGTAFNYPSWYQWSFPDFQYQEYELDETEFDESFPDLADFPAIDNYVASATNQSKSLTISENTHYGTLTNTSNSNYTITLDLQNQDLYLVVDNFNISGWRNIIIKGNHTLYLFVDDCTGTQPLLLTSNKTIDPDQVYIVSHDYIPLNAGYPLYGHVFYEGMSTISTGGYASIVGSLATDATTVSFSGSDPMKGLVYAPNAAVTMEGSSIITGRLVAKSLSMIGSAKINYRDSNITWAVPSALLKQKYTVNVTADPAGGGTVSPGTTTVNSGETIKITATPASGYTFTGFTSNSTSMIPDDSGNLTVTGNVNIVAHFAQQAVQYDVNVSADPDGAGIVSPTYVRVNSGETITITATPASGYTFTGFTSNNTAMVPDGSGNLTVTGNVNVVAHFEQTINDDYINGILGEYYDDSELHDYALRMKRIDGNISNNFGYAAPVNKNDCIEPNTFSIRWSGYIKPTVTGDYYFKTYSDDGVIVNVNGQTVIENWGLLSLSYKSATEAVHLEAGQYYPITVEYQQLPYYAAVFLFWQADGGQMSLVPEANLYIEKTVYEEYVAYEDMTQYFNQISKNGEGFKNVFYSEDNGGNRVDEYAEISNINYEWRNDAPGSISSDVFYGESDGYLEAKFTEDTTLTFTVDDSIRVWINDNLVIDQWNWNSNRKFSYTFAAEAGTKYKMHIEYMDKGLGATLQMSWSGDALGSEVVPSSYMYAPLD